MLFKLSHSEDPFELNPGLRAIEQYKKLTGKQFTFVALTSDSDWDNPLRSLPEKQRREKATKVAGYLPDTDGRRMDKTARNMINGLVPSVEAAIAEYRENQFNESKANLEAVENQIAEARNLMNIDKLKACEVKKVTKEKNDAGKEIEVTKVYIDYELAFNLADKALKLGAGLAKLVLTKKELKAIVQAEEPIKLEGIETFTSSDLVPVGDEESDSESLSTIDRHMATKV